VSHFEQSVAAIWAAYGVFFLDPLKPIYLRNSRKSPVLLRRQRDDDVLKVALMCASPTASTRTTLFFDLFGCCSGCCLSSHVLFNYTLVAFFLLATVLRLPFLVRVLSWSAVREQQAIAMADTGNS